MLAQPMPMHIDSGLKALYRESWLKGAVVFFRADPDRAGDRRQCLRAGSAAGVVCGRAGQRSRWRATPPMRAARHGPQRLPPACRDRQCQPHDAPWPTTLNNSRRAGKRLLGFFDDRHAGRHARADIQHLGPMRELANYVRQNDVEVIALPMSSQARIVQLLDEMRDTTVSIYFVPESLHDRPDPGASG